MSERREEWRAQWHNGHLYVVQTDVFRVVAEVEDHPDMSERAALLAAAPDMLRVLRDVERTATELGAKGYPLNAIRAAIAKAEAYL